MEVYITKRIFIKKVLKIVKLIVFLLENILQGGIIMLMNKRTIANVILASVCTGALFYVNAFAADKTVNGFYIVNGVLKGVDDSVAGEITIPSDVIEIGEQAFFDNKKITKVTIPGTVTKIQPGAFIGCKNLTEVNIKEGVEVIAADCFADSSNLKSVTIPSSVKEIEADAFQRCEKLEDVQFKADSPKVGRNALNNTPWCKNLRDDDGLCISGSVLLDGSEASGSITIPSNVKVIQDGAFSDNEQLKEVNLTNVIGIGKYAFFNCSNLVDVQLSDNLKYIDEDAFIGCNKLSTINIPNSVNEIKAHAFEERTQLTGNTEVYKKANEKYDAEQKDRFDVWLYRYPQGWNTYDGKRFYKNSKGEKQTGWMELNGKSYYFYSNGVQATGFINLNGTHYYLQPGGSGDDFGKLITGWKSIDGNWYYFSPQSEGDKVKGFMKTAWLYNNGNWYYFYSDGKMATGFINLNVTYYYLDESVTSNIGIM